MLATTLDGASRRETVVSPAIRARVLFVDHSSRLAGAELVLVDIVRQLRETATVLLFEDGPLRAVLAGSGAAAIVARRAGDFTTIKRDRSLLRGLPLVGQMLGVMREIRSAARKHDLVYANSQKAFVLAAIAARLARRPLIWHLHDIISAAHFGAVHRRLVVTLANLFATRVIVPSRAAAEAFTAAGGRSRLLRVVPNGLDIDPSPSETRAQLGLPEGFLFGIFSRLAPWKGQHIAIEALGLLPDARCIIVGDALFGENDYAAGLRRVATRAGVADRIQFLGHRHDVPRLMRTMNAVVHPSVDPEPFGRTLVEAMLVRVPVIAAHAGAAPEILDAGRAGLLVPPGDPRALSQALEHIHAGGEHIRAMLDVAHRRALALYSAARMRCAIGAVIGDVLAEHRA